MEINKDNAINELGKLYFDLVMYQKSYLEKKGVDVNHIKIGDMPIYYCEYQLRIVSNIKHQVFISQELLKNEQYTNYEKVIKSIKQKLENGESLRQYLSKGILNITQPDKMLNEWGVLHFHLSNEIESNGFVKRTGDLLFAYRDMYEENKIYFLNIYSHSDWTKSSMFEILNNNWEEVLEKYEITSLTDIRPEINDIDRKKLRKADINTHTEINGVPYMMIGGGGLSAIGTNFNCSFVQSQYIKKLRKLEDELVKKYQISNRKLELRISNNYVYVYLNIHYLNENFKYYNTDIFF